MEPETFMLKFWGILLSSVGLIYLVRPSVCKQVLSMMEERNFVLISGWFSVILGAMTLSCSVNQLSLKVIGFLFLLSGTVRIAFFDKIPVLASFFKERTYLPLSLSAAGFLTGVWLLLKTF